MSLCFHLINYIAIRIVGYALIKDALTELPVLPVLPLPPFTLLPSLLLPLLLPIWFLLRRDLVRCVYQLSSKYSINKMKIILPMTNTVPIQVRDSLDSFCICHTIHALDVNVFYVYQNAINTAYFCCRNFRVLFFHYFLPKTSGDVDLFVLCYLFILFENIFNSNARPE